MSNLETMTLENAKFTVVMFVHAKQHNTRHVCFLKAPGPKDYGLTLSSQALVGIGRWRRNRRRILTNLLVLTLPPCTVMTNKLKEPRSRPNITCFLCKMLRVLLSYSCGCTQTVRLLLKHSGMLFGGYPKFLGRLAPRNAI